MALTLALGPLGRRLGTNEDTAAVSASGTDALFSTYDLHSLTTGDFIYVHSTRWAYNGFWYVQVISTRTFKIREYATSDFQEYIGSGAAPYIVSEGPVIWNCVHLPIVFKLKSDKWPTNSVDTARTVSSFSSSNGYTQMTLSGDIKASGSADALEQVEISGTASLDGVYRILTWNSDINIVIDLTYASTNVFTGGTVQYYYGNYHARIRIYGGLPATHYWAGYKPYELLTEIRQVPDANGLVVVNVNEFLKQKINIIGNNLLLDTLPNNTDAFTYFKIAYAESYDDANQYGTNDLNVTEYVGAYTESDDYAAVNAKLPFKNRNSGFLTDYVFSISGSNTDVPSKMFLTGFTRPVLFVGKYFDVSFILGISATRAMRRKVYSANGTLLGSFLDVFTNMDEGVFRYPIEQSAFLESYLTIEMTTVTGSTTIGEVLTIGVDDTCSSQDFYVTWLNHLGGYDYWNFKAETEYRTNIIESKTQEKNIFPTWPKSYGEDADSMTQQTKRKSKDAIVLNSQYLDEDQMDGLSLMVESPLVQQVNSIYDRRTIILGNSSLNKKVDNQKLLMLTVEAEYTDENPSQSL